MEKINTHGLKMVGLEEAAKETMRYAERGYRDDIYYDKDTGEVWTRFFASENEWAEYHDPDVIKVGSTCRHLSAQSIADMIAEKLRMIELYTAENDVEW